MDMRHGVPIIDWSPIGKLGEQFKTARREAVRERTLRDLGSNGDYASAARALLAAGDTQGGLSLAQLARSDRDFDFRRQESERAQHNADRTYGLQERLATRREEPDQLRIVRAAGMDPASPEGRKALFPRTDTPLSATDKRAVMEAEDELPALQGTLETLQRAKELNDKTFIGYTAGARGSLGAKLPSWMVPDSMEEPAKATVEWQNIMSTEALKNMAATLKGATTNFELQNFERRLADPSTPPDVRGRIIDRMAKLAERQAKIKADRIREMRGGTYFQPNGGAQQSATPQQVAPVAQQPQQGATAGEPMPGARQGRDGKWYLPDPNRPGRYLLVVQ